MLDAEGGSWAEVVGGATLAAGVPLPLLAAASEHQALVLPFS